MALSKHFAPKLLVKPLLVASAGLLGMSSAYAFQSNWGEYSAQCTRSGGVPNKADANGPLRCTAPSTPNRQQGPNAEDQRRQREARRQRDITWFSEEGAEYARRGDWPNAIRSLEEALDHDPDNEDLARDLASARFEQARAAASAAQARAEASAAQARAVALATAAAPRVTARPVNTDSSLVDAREASRRRAGRPLDGLPRLELMENSPGREGWLRGMDAIVHRDWPLALAWFRTAQRLDPTNPALARAVILAAWTIDRQRPLQLPLPQDYDMLFVDRSATAAASAVARRPADPSGLQLPEASDAEYLFNPATSEAARLLEQLWRDTDYVPTQALSGQAIAMLDRRMGGIRIANREAQTDGITTDAENARIDVERRRAAQGMDEDARLLLARGDRAGALNLAHSAHLQVPGNFRYRTLREALRQTLVGRQPTPAQAAAVRRPRN